MMSPVLAAFPRRPLTLKAGQHPIRLWLLAIFLLLLFGGGGLFMGRDIMSSIRDDLAISAAAKPAPGVRMTGECGSRLFLFQSCNIRLAWQVRGTENQRFLSYMFVAPHMGSWSAVPMMDPARPDLVGTNLGLTYLTNRITTAIGVAIFLLTMIGFGFFAAIRMQRKSGVVKAMSGRPLEPVPVRFVLAANGFWLVEDERGVKSSWPAGRKDQPFMLDETQVLALRDPVGGLAFPLDEELRLVDLTDEERAQVHGAWAKQRPAM